MISKERLLAIQNLKLAGKIEDMNDEQMREYEQLLVTFIENFPGDEEKIKAALTANLNERIDYTVLANNLTAMCKTLGRIHADDLSRECRKQIVELKSAEREKIEAYVTGFLGSVAMLSIDIQMAKYLKETRYVQEKEDSTARTADITAETEKKSTGAKSAHNERIILAVDDAAISLSMLKHNMRGWPYKLVCVSSGSDALQYLKTHQPVLFILDIDMPVMDGYELAEKIKESGQEAPIIFLTGNATKGNVIRAIEAGASDFMVKPIDGRNLAYKLRKYL